MKAAFVAGLLILVSAGAAFAQAPSYRRAPPKEIQRDFLSEIPNTLTPLCYPDSKFVMGYLTRYAKTKTTKILRVKAHANLATVADWYERTLPNLGYKPGPKSALTKEQTMSIYATKADGSTCSIDLFTDKSGSDTSINLTVNDIR